MEKLDVLVVGGGASGLAAGVAAARAGASVLILEKNHVPGRKNLSTGAGKCNFSNSRVTPGSYHPPAANFLEKTFAALPPQDVHGFFADLGLLSVTDERGRCFPRSMKAQDVVGALCNEFAFRGGRIQALSEVVSVSPSKGGGFTVEAFRVAPQWEKKRARGEKTEFTAASVIVAAGGPCYPQIGGSDSGRGLLLALGHSVSPFTPVIAPLRSDEPFLPALDGVRAEAALRLYAGDASIAESSGELLFTASGVSGPAVLDLSRDAVSALKDCRVTLSADFFPEIQAHGLAALLRGRAAAFGKRPFRHFACGLHNEKLLKAAAARCGAGWEEPAGPGLEKFAACLKDFRVSVSGGLGFGEAMVAAGGCALSEIDPATFASRLVPGLYVTGELLDLDGDSGGYNLHLAWTSGLLAGKAAAESRNRA